jgi:hypothetical protein
MSNEVNYDVEMMNELVEWLKDGAPGYFVLSGPDVGDEVSSNVTPYIIHGAQGCGKTRAGKAILKLLPGAEDYALVDGWDGVSRVADMTVVLTNVPPPYGGVATGCHVLAFQDL